MLGGSWGGLEIYGVIASGGMATIEYARQSTAAGGLELAIKRPHAHFANDRDFVKMFMDEARLSIRIQHANVVRTLGVLEHPHLGLVLEYVLGESLARLLQQSRERGEGLPVPIASALIAGVLHGLHAAHETRGEEGEPLQIVHRDVSPDNILVGADGIVRVLDFGVAKALRKLRTTPRGELKGKLEYVAPEQLCGNPTTRRTDVYGAGVVLWEALAGQSLFGRDYEATTLDAVLRAPVPRLDERRADVPEALERIVRTALARDPAQRFDSAQAMARALEVEVGVASQSAIIDWLERLGGDALRARSASVQTMRAARGGTSSRQLHVPPAAAAIQGTVRRSEPATMPALGSPLPAAASLPAGDTAGESRAHLARPDEHRQRERRRRAVLVSGLSIASAGAAASVLLWAASPEPLRSALESEAAPAQVREQTALGQEGTRADASSTRASPSRAVLRIETAADRTSTPPAGAGARRPAREITAAASPRAVAASRSVEGDLDGAGAQHRASTTPEPRTTRRAARPAAAAANVRTPRDSKADVPKADHAPGDPGPSQPQLEAAEIPTGITSLRPSAGRLRATGPHACYETVLRNGVATLVPKSSCL